MHIKAQSLIKVEKIPSLEADKQILRGVMMEELEAINLYEQMRASTEDGKIQEILTGILKDEQEHFNKASLLLSILEPVTAMPEMKEEEEPEEEED